jgi:SAM-dependent methyltransferase
LVQERQLLSQNPRVHLTFCDVDPSGLEQRRSAFGEEYAARFDVRVADLNFAELEPGAYDLIVSSNTLHHIINLEHVAEEIHRALTPDGVFLVYDYTGASGFRFAPDQKRLFEAIYAREHERRPDAGLPHVTWHDVDEGNNSPFEAVRSADVIPVLDAHLARRSIRTAGTVPGLLMFAGLTDSYTPPPAPARAASLSDRIRRRIAGRESRAAPEPLIWERMLSAECFRELCLLDDVVSDAGLWPPLSTFAVYGR